MFLYKIKIDGFKSFANKTEIEFSDDDLVGIVGPNGSGKSNIIDAVKWVFGARSKKNLRASNNNDFLFAGNDINPPAKQAKVTLYLNNKNKLLKTDSEKLSISRSITRDKSENQYMVDNTVSTLAQIKNLVMGTGLGRVGLSIISQGSVNKIIDAKAKEKRLIFEDIADITVFRNKIKETNVVLVKINQNLKILKNAKKSLEVRLKPLLEQVEKIKKYENLKNNLKFMELTYLKITYTTKNDELKLLEKEIYEKTHSDKQNTSELTTIRDTIKKTNEDIEIIDENIRKLTDKQYLINSKIQSLSSFDLNTNDPKELRMILESKNSELKAYVEMTDEQTHKLDNTIIEKNRYIDQLKSIEVKMHDFNQAIYRINHHLQMLENRINNSSVYSKAVNSVLQNKESFVGLKGPLVEFIKTQSEYEIAINSAMGQYSNDLVIEKSENAKPIISFIKKNQLGTISFLPIDKIRQSNNKTINLNNQVRGFVDYAINLVNFDSQIENIVSFVFSTTLVFKDFESAKNYNSFFSKNRLVTLDGTIFNTSGRITGGQRNFTSISTLKREYKQLKEKLALLVKKMEVFNLEKENLTEKIDHTNLNLNLLANNQDKNESKIIEIKGVIERIKKKIGDSNNNSNTNNEFKDYQKQLLDIQVNLEKEIQNKKRLIKKNSENNLNLERKNNLFLEINKNLNLINSRVIKLKMEIQNISQNIFDNYEMTIDKLLDFKEVVKFDSLSNLREDVALYKQRIKELGDINFMAKKEYDEVSEKYETIKKDYDVINESYLKLTRVITDLQRQIVNFIKKFVEDVNKNFDKIFNDIFMGGTAKLTFEDEDNLLESGIEILVTPIGKRVKSILLFSGGEKSLIVISLLFAILETKRIPLVILDETEAALDEVNVEVYANYCKKLNKKTQVLIITHRVGTMSVCDRLLGVTMQQKGISAVINTELSLVKDWIEE